MRSAVLCSIAVLFALLPEGQAITNPQFNQLSQNKQRLVNQLKNFAQVGAKADDLEFGEDDTELLSKFNDIYGDDEDLSDAVHALSGDGFLDADLAREKTQEEMNELMAKV